MEHATVCTRSEDNFGESVLSCHVTSRGQMHVVRFDPAEPSPSWLWGQLLRTWGRIHKPPLVCEEAQESLPFPHPPTQLRALNVAESPQ